MNTDSKREFLIGYITPYLALNLYPGTRIVDRAVLELAFKVADINPEYRRDFARTHFLICKKVRSFLGQLEAMRYQFSRSTWSQEEIAVGAIRGPINWGKTMSARMAVGDPDYPLFVTRPRQRTFDTPENQLLTFLLRRLRDLLEEVDTSGPVPVPEADTLRADSLLSYLTWAEQEVRATLSTAQLRSVRVPAEVDARLLENTAASRDELYSGLVQIYDLYVQMGLDEDCPSLQVDAIETLLTYSQTERLLEFAVLFKVIALLDKRLHSAGGVRTWQPLVGRSEYAAVWNLPNGHLTVSLQKMPSFVESSVYTTLLKQTGLRPSRTTPDIAIAWTSKTDSQDNWVHFVEVKDNCPTESPSAMDYFRDSLYKVMGYALDFSKFYPAPGSDLPHVTLAVWGGLPKSSTSDDIWVTQLESDDVFETLAERIAVSISPSSAQ